MRDANGVGLAATQVGVIRRVFIFLPDAESDPVAVVNPVLAESSDELVVDDEGCLSLVGVQMPVERPVSVKLEGRDLDGGELSFDLTDHPARVVQHEVDHLDGVLYPMRMTDLRQLSFESELRHLAADAPEERPE